MKAGRKKPFADVVGDRTELARRVSNPSGRFWWVQYSRVDAVFDLEGRFESEAWIWETALCILNPREYLRLEEGRGALQWTSWVCGMSHVPEGLHLLPCASSSACDVCNLVMSVLTKMKNTDYLLRNVPLHFSS